MPLCATAATLALAAFIREELPDYLTIHRWLDIDSGALLSSYFWRFFVWYAIIWTLGFCVVACCLAPRQQRLQAQPFAVPLVSARCQSSALVQQSLQQAASRASGSACVDLLGFILCCPCIQWSHLHTFAFGGAKSKHGEGSGGGARPSSFVSTRRTLLCCREVTVEAVPPRMMLHSASPLAATERVFGSEPATSTACSFHACLSYALLSVCCPCCCASAWLGADCTQQPPQSFLSPFPSILFCSVPFLLCSSWQSLILEPSN